GAQRFAQGPPACGARRARDQGLSGQRRGEADDRTAAAGIALGGVALAAISPASAPESARTPSKSALPRAGGAESLREGIEIGGREVGDRPIGEAVLGPGHNIIAGDLLWRHRRRPAQWERAEADQVLAMAINERRHRSASDDVDAAADQGKAFASEIDDARRLGNAAVEPRLHRVPVGGSDVERLRCY